jgi:protein-disulfide isomerase
MLRLLRSPFTMLLLAAVASAQKAPPAAHAGPTISARPRSEAPAPSDETVNAFMKKMFGNDPQMSWKVQSIEPSEDPGLAKVTVLMAGPQGQQLTAFYVTPDGKHAVVGEMIPFGADPFAPARGALQRGAKGPSRGPASAPVEIVEFSDLQCPHCKAAQPTIDKLLAEEPQARFMFENFPLASHNWAFKAAAYADCVGRTSGDAFWKFVKAVYEAQENITAQNADEKLGGIAASSGADAKTVAACAITPETKSRVDQSVALGKAVGVEGTPTLFINGRKIGNLNLPPEYLKSIVDYMAKQGK